MRRSFLFNPFVKIAGGRALLWGGVIMIMTAVVAYYSDTHFDGVLDIHIGSAAAWWVYFVEMLLSWSIAVAAFFFAGKRFSSSDIRLIDVAGTIALARAPYFIGAVGGFMVPAAGNELPEVSISLLVSSFILLLVVIWHIALLYNAVMVSCNFKKHRPLIFIITLLIAEIVSKVFFMYFYRWV